MARIGGLRVASDALGVMRPPSDREDGFDPCRWWGPAQQLGRGLVLRCVSATPRARASHGPVRRGAPRAPRSGICRALMDRMEARDVDLAGQRHPSVEVALRLWMPGYRPGASVARAPGLRGCAPLHRDAAAIAGSRSLPDRAVRPFCRSSPRRPGSRTMPPSPRPGGSSYTACGPGDSRSPHAYSGDGAFERPIDGLGTPVFGQVGSR